MGVKTMRNGEVRRIDGTSFPNQIVDEQLVADIVYCLRCMCRGDFSALSTMTGSYELKNGVNRMFFRPKSRNRRRRVLRANERYHMLLYGDYYTGKQKRGKNGVSLVMQVIKQLRKVRQTWRGDSRTTS